MQGDAAGPPELRHTRAMSVGERVADASNRFYLWIRHPQAWRTEVADGVASFEDLRGHKYCLLETFKRSGEAIPTPVWFGLGDGKLYFRSEARVGKVKRVRANGQVRVAPCTVRGKPLGPAVEGRARVLDATEEPQAEAALEANYGLGRKLYEGVAMNVGPEAVYVEVSPGRGPA